MLGQILAATIGVLAFAILFHAPRRSYALCAFSGGFCWAMYLLGQGVGMGGFLASTLAVLALTVLARVLSVAMQMPATVFIVSGIFPIVPGAGIYNTAYGLLTRNWARFQHSGLETLALAGAIAIGILIGMGAPAKAINSLGSLLRRAVPNRLRRQGDI